MSKATARTTSNLFSSRFARDPLARRFAPRRRSLLTGKPLNEWLDHNDNKSDDDPYHLPVSYYGYEERGPSFNFVTSTMWERIDEADVGAGSNPAKFHRKLLRWKEGVEMGFLTQSKMPADLVRGIEEAKEDLDEENKQRYHFLDGAKKAYVKKKRLEREKREPKVVKPKVIDPRDAYDYGFDTIIPPGGEKEGAEGGWSKATAMHRLISRLTTFCSSLRFSPRPSLRSHPLQTHDERMK